MDGRHDDAGWTYMLVDLSAGPSAAPHYPIHVLDEAPAGGWSDVYKTTRLVLRRVPSGRFLMGSPGDELGRMDDETSHKVVLTEGFCIGIFPVTQRQWYMVMGRWPSFFDGAGPAMNRDVLPVEQVSFDTIRGEDSGAMWPANGSVDADAFLGRLRAGTGQAFDLPTEAQWEYAARAGSETALNSGKNLTREWNCPNAMEVGGWGRRDGTSPAHTTPVGSYMANRWGLYDIHANVCEWCLDWYGEYPGRVTNPAGPDSGYGRVVRGGGWGLLDRRCRVASRNAYPSGYGSYRVGFRVLVAVPSGVALTARDRSCRAATEGVVHVKEGEGAPWSEGVSSMSAIGT